MNNYLFKFLLLLLLLLKIKKLKVIMIYFLVIAALTFKNLSNIDLASFVCS